MISPGNKDPYMKLAAAIMLDAYKHLRSTGSMEEAQQVLDWFEQNSGIYEECLELGVDTLAHAQEIFRDRFICEWCTEPVLNISGSPARHGLCKDHYVEAINEGTLDR